MRAHRTIRPAGAFDVFPRCIFIAESYSKQSFVFHASILAKANLIVKCIIPFFFVDVLWGECYIDRKSGGGRPEGHIDQPDHHQHLDQRPNDRRKGLAGGNPKNGYGHGDGCAPLNPWPGRFASTTSNLEKQQGEEFTTPPNNSLEPTALITWRFQWFFANRGSS